MDKQGIISEFIEGLKLFFKGMFDFKDKSNRFIKKEASEAQDNFLLLCFGDLLGLPMPTSYYAIELLPYLAEDIQSWERRMIRRSEIWQEKWADYDIFG